MADQEFILPIQGHRTAAEIAAINDQIARGVVEYPSSQEIVLRADGQSIRGTPYRLVGSGIAAQFKQVLLEGSGSVPVGYASESSLAIALPASTNAGKFAYVGAAPPYTQYVSDGYRWRMLADNTSVASAITVYNEDGTVSNRCMPKRSRVLQAGVKLWTPTALTGTTARTVLAYTGAAFIAQELTTGPMVEIAYLDGTYSSASWTGLTIPAQPTGLMQFVIWIDDYQNGAAAPLTGGSAVTLTGPSGSLTYTFSSPAYKPGWNTLQLWDPADVDVNAVMQKTGISTTGTKTINFAESITGVAYTLNSPAAGAKVRIVGLFSQTIVKPMVALTFDTSSTNVFDNFCPAFVAKGLTATLRAGGSDAFRGAAFAAKAITAYDQGFDVNNGSWSRLNLSSTTLEADFVKEVGLQKNWQNRYGLVRGATLFSSAGNGLPKASIYRKVFPLFGLKSAKSGSGSGRVNTCGPAGFDDRYALTAMGWPGRTLALQYIRGLLKLGGLMMFFAHECEVAGAEPPPDSASPGSGGGMYQEDAVYFANYLRGLVDAGTLDVVSASQMDNILDGLA